jgi:hypothetical protein
MTLDHKGVPHFERQILSGNNYEEISEACMSNESQSEEILMMEH